MAMAHQNQVLDGRETATLIGSDKVEGTPVYRSNGDRVGQVERVMIDRATTINIPVRPEFNTASTTKDRVWNTILRGDQQLNANHTWGVRWLRESSPQRNQLVPVLGRQVTLNASREESDVDQATVGTLTSVLGNARVNTARVTFTRENVAFGNPGFNSNGRRQDALPPTLQYGLDVGSGGQKNPRVASAVCRSPLSTPGSTMA